MALVRKSVARAEARMLMTLFPSRTDPIMVSCLSISRLTRPAARSPSFSSWCMRERLAPVSEVSAAENRPDRASSSTSMGARARRAAITGSPPPR
jgi:hypothetical protein